MMVGLNGPRHPGGGWNVRPTVAARPAQAPCAQKTSQRRTFDFSFDCSGIQTSIHGDKHEHSSSPPGVGQKSATLLGLDRRYPHSRIFFRRARISGTIRCAFAWSAPGIPTRARRSLCKATTSRIISTARSDITARGRSRKDIYFQSTVPSPGGAVKSLGGSRPDRQPRSTHLCAHFRKLFFGGMRISARFSPSVSKKRREIHGGGAMKFAEERRR
jgi:hypothetical protein